MKWLTQKEIKAAAKKSEKAAIACSVLHWEQILTATKRDFHEPSAGTVYSIDCALCIRHMKHGRTQCCLCSLGKIKLCRDDTWQNARGAMDEYLDGKINFRQFRRKAQPMLDLLRSL